MTARRSLPGLVLLAISTAAAAGAQPVPPSARQAPTTLQIHGTTLVDPYAWLENESDPEVIAYLEAENQYSLAVMHGTEALQRKLFDEMASRIDETDPQPPRFFGKDVYYLRHAPGKQYLLLCRRRGGVKGAEEVLFDLNTLAGEGKKPAVGVWRLSPDSRFLAWSVDRDGSESFTIFVQSLEDKRRPAEQIAGAGRWLEWAADGQTLFYTTPYGRIPNRLMRRRVGSPGSPAQELYSESANGCGLSLMKTVTGNHLVLLTYGAEWEVRVLPATDPSGDFRILEPRRKGVRYWVAEEGGFLYMLVNAAGAHSRILRTAVGSALDPAWEEVFPAGRGWDISDFDAVAGNLILSVREDGLSRIRVHDLATHAEHVVPFPDPLGQVRLVTAFERDPQVRRSPVTRSVQFFYESFVRPRTLFEYDLESQRLRELWRSSVRNYRPGDYGSRRIFATSPDGTRVPISLVYKRPLIQDGRRPLLLYGFGFAGYRLEPWFEMERSSLLDRGVIFGVAHVRGGGEFGPAWHQAATGVNKMRTFTDFIACAEHLVRAGFTSSARLATTGASAGGMLVTGVANMRPDLMQAVVAKVPATNLFHRQSGSETLRDNPEAGNPNRESDFAAMLAYLPYYNVKAQAYPHMLVTASRSDPRVSFYEVAKFTARLRSVKTGDRMLLLRVDMAGGGHMGSPGREDRLRETAFEYAFLLRALNVER